MVSTVVEPAVSPDAEPAVPVMVSVTLMVLLLAVMAGAALAILKGWGVTGSAVPCASFSTGAVLLIPKEAAPPVSV